MDNSFKNNKPDKVQNENQETINANANFLYSLTSNRLQNQLQQIDSLDSKTISLLGFSCTLIAILAAAISIIKITSSEILISYIVLGISAVAFIFIVIRSLKSYHTKGWRVGADLKEAWAHSKKYEQPKMLRWAARSFTDAYQFNIQSGLIKEKLSTVNQSIWALIIQILFSILAIILIYLY